MSAELDKARGALESFDATRDAYEDARTRDDRTYLLSMLDNHDAHDVDHLRAALAEVDRLTAALAGERARIRGIVQDTRYAPCPSCGLHIDADDLLNDIGDDATQETP